MSHFLMNDKHKPFHLNADIVDAVLLIKHIVSTFKALIY